ncbi:SapC family protein [Luteimonas sp. RD2P54]|uniref:SapC family protein n=1 Tax=Luteimonas endophytica TaxID=3042023 RepID=A0ABT6J6A3_9GAMM|nr:SapC family protein [Luteimonas endophytica]MDH5822362.1 SapC family protein [Luteimonas endophytica]
MPRYELLNNVAHKDLRVVTRFGPEFGDGVGLVPAFPTEFAELQREFPIFFRKDRERGGFQSVAVLGFGSEENLYLDNGRWNASYLPGYLAKGPFVIGFQERRDGGEVRTEPVIHVDLDHPRVSLDEGEPVFQPQGGNSPYLQRIATILRGIHDGVEGGKAMFAAFESLDLIQPVKLEIKLDGDHGVDLTGLYGIDRERLAALEPEPLHGLHRTGFLEGAYLVLASLHNMPRLIAEKQRRLRQPAEAGTAGTRA